MSKTIEIFKDGSPQSDVLEAKVRALACPRCTILVYDAASPDSEAHIQAKAAEYGIESWPAVTVDGQAVSPEQLNKSRIAKFIRNLLHK